MESTLLDALPEQDRREVLRLGRRRRFARSEVVFHEGDPGDSFHVLLRGHAGVRITTPLGDVAMMRVLGPGQVFGELALVSPAPRNATVFALDSCETLSWHSQQFDRLRRTYPAVERVLLEAMVAEVRRLSTQLSEVMYVPVEKRLYRRLGDLALLYGDEGPVSIPLTQEDLAQLTGTTRPTANRVLRSAEDAGLVRITRGHVEVLDRAGLSQRGR